MRYVSSDHLD